MASDSETEGCLTLILLIMFIVLCVKQCTIQDYAAETNANVERLEIRTRDYESKLDSILVQQKQLLDKQCN